MKQRALTKDCLTPEATLGSSTNTPLTPLSLGPASSHLSIELLVRVLCRLEGERRNVCPRPFLQAGFGDFFEAAAEFTKIDDTEGVTLEEQFDSGITHALTRSRASQKMGPAWARKEAAHEERQNARNAEVEASTPAARAAQGLSREQKADAAAEMKSEAKALVGQFSPEELEAVREEILHREVEEAPPGSFNYEYPAELEDEPDLGQMEQDDFGDQDFNPCDMRASYEPPLAEGTASYIEEQYGDAGDEGEDE